MPDSNAQESQRAIGSRDRDHDRDRDRDRDRDDGDSLFDAEWNNDLICGSR
jgi:hypothetical protein